MLRALRIPLRFAQIALAILLACGPRMAGGEVRPRFVGVLEGGKRIEGSALFDWHDEKAKPRLDGQPLFDSAAPLSWLRDRTLPQAEPSPAFLELHSGDRLPGTVVGVHSGATNAFDPYPAFFRVRPSVELSPPNDLPVREVRVLASQVKRIVWQRQSGGGSAPGTAMLRSGSELTFKSHRFGADFVSLLLREGQVRIPFAELAEIRLPSPPLWEQHWDEVARLVTRADSLLVQYETTDDLIVTASRERMAFRFEGNPVDSKRWVHALQPAWSLDPLWIPSRNVALRRFWKPQTVPLPRIAALALNQSPADAELQKVRLNRSTLDTPLRSAVFDFGSGVGVHAPHRLIFPLPLGAMSFRTLVALDRLARSGGCARGRIRLEPGGKQLWESPLLIGAEALSDAGQVAFPGSSAGSGSLVLEADAVLQGRPSGADPLNVRDYLDWVEAALEISPAEVQSQLDQRGAKLVSAWSEWEYAPPAKPGRLELQFQRDTRVETEEGFLTGVRVLEKEVVLRRVAPLGPQDEWFVAAVTVAGDCNPRPEVQLLVDGKQVAGWKLATRLQNREDNVPLVFPLAPFRSGSKPVTLEVRQTPGVDKTPPVLWRSLSLSERLPTVVALVPQAAQAFPLIPAEKGAALITGAREQAVVRLTPAGRFQIGLGEQFPIRERPQWGEYRFLRFAVKKQGKGRLAVELQPAAARTKPLRYDLGRGKPSYEAAIRVWEGDLPSSDWIFVTRDLYADFGQFELDSLILGCPEGDWGEVKALQLARKPNDFELLPKP